MKKNEKGFTLIELLAVIIILAIIALIATPIVLNVVNKLRQKAAEDSTYGVVEAVKSYHAEQMLETSLDVSDTFYVKWETNNGTTTAKEGKNATDSLTESGIKIGGTKPTGGSVTINNDGTITVDKLKINGYECSSNENATDTNVSCEIAN